MRIWFLLVTIGIVGLFASGALAARGEETKFKLALVPCGLLGEDDAGGELEWEADSGLKLEVWGATRLAGRGVVFVVDGHEIARLALDEGGAARAAFRLAVPQSLTADQVQTFGEDGTPVLGPRC